MLGFQRLDAWKGFAFHPFKKRAASGGNMGKVLRDAGMIHRCDSVTSASNSDKVAFLAAYGCGLRGLHSRFVKWRHLKRP